MAIRSLLLSSALVATLGSAALADNPVRIDDPRSGGSPVSIGIQEQSAGGTVALRLAPRVDQNVTADLSVERWLDFKNDIFLNIRTDPALVPSARVLEMVASIRIVDDYGAVIASDYDINAEHDIVLAFSGGSAEITHIARDDQGLIITALVRDEAGNVIDPPQSALALYTTGGEKLCFTEEVINAREEVREDIFAPGSASTIPMTFAVLMDRSGSMAGHMEELQDAARGFIDALPNRAGCLVGAFSEGTASFAPDEGFGFFQCRARHFPMSGLQAGGGTDLYGSLAHLYDWMNQSALENHQRAVIIITDGAVNRNLEREAEVIAAKGDVVTFVYFLGGDEERFLQSLADSYLSHEGDLRDELPRFFNVVRDVYTSQTVLRQSQCAAEEGAGQ
ncbi:von Willebrand factor type A domain-containing protein [Hasllibacter halocynthiae]|uniref:von Willebrand factor type A domain-containing protein n=1 Tax=Hasllibacter halocynthiae TaxID=595589 RepID=A0A2T0X7C1_9RHOB|nr:vWA domain-containing protein [Hasllibacter halocynthiae]PRY94795.1 von Willebrand factor type A domain-containing protein [Hasllibacter halocynthiae]